MPFHLLVLSGFERCFKKLGHREKQIADLIVNGLKSYFEASLPVSSQPYVFESYGRSYRLVFKKIRNSIWEAYIEGRVRVLTRLEKDSHSLVFVGNHDQVRQFLRKN